jgi:hypothetical protein
VNAALISDVCTGHRHGTGSTERSRSVAASGNLTKRATASYFGGALSTKNEDVERDFDFANDVESLSDELMREAGRRVDPVLRGHQLSRHIAGRDLHMVYARFAARCLEAARQRNAAQR